MLIIIVFLIAGIWHGPTWCFLIFGLCHGIGLVINHLYRKYKFFELNSFLSCLITFNFVNFSFIFFRSQNLTEALSILNNLVDYNRVFELTNDIILIEILDIKFYLVLLTAILISFFGINSNQIIEKFKQI